MGFWRLALVERNFSVVLGSLQGGGDERRIVIRARVVRWIVSDSSGQPDDAFTLECLQLCQQLVEQGVDTEFASPVLHVATIQLVALSARNSQQIKPLPVRHLATHLIPQELA